MAISVQIEAGTSVAPRQRPKAATAAALHHHTLPLVAPPSPSPRNNVASPSIAGTPSAAATSISSATSTAVATANSNSSSTSAIVTVSQTSAPIPVASSVPDANETFAAQFQANFPPISSISPATAEITTPSSSSSTAICHQTSAAVTAAGYGDADVETLTVDPNLFKTAFPDPFVESSSIAAGAVVVVADETEMVNATVAANTKTPSAPNSLHGSGTALFAAISAAAAAAAATAEQSDLSQVSSPIKSATQLLGASETVSAGHRRNVSDTSAFNK